MLPFLYFERNEKDVKAVEKCKNIAACPLTFIGGHDSIGECPLSYAGGHATTGRCPLTFVEGHSMTE